MKISTYSIKLSELIVKEYQLLVLLSHEPKFPPWDLKVNLHSQNLVSWDLDSEAAWH